MLNKVFIVGNLGKDVTINSMKNGNKAANLSVATSHKYLDSSGNKKESTEWHRVVVFGKTAEYCHKYLSKGAKVIVEGRLRSNKYTDKNGIERHVTEILCERIHSLSYNNSRDEIDEISHVAQSNSADIPDETHEDTQDELGFF